MKICHVITGLTFGGAQTLLLDLSRGAKELGHDVHVIGLYPGPLRKRFEDHGIPVDELDLKGLVDLKTLARLVGRLKKLKPDIVHTHLGKADTYGRVAAAIAGCRNICTTCHNIEDWKANPVLRIVDNQTARLAKRIISVSENVTRSLDPRVLPKVRTIYNGIDVTQFRPRPRAPKDRLVLAVIGRLEEQKGHTYLLQALEILIKRESPAPGAFEVWFIGTGSLEGQLREEAAKRSLSSLVHFKGVRSDVHELLGSEIDVLVLPSLWEGLPIVLLEGMAAEVPVIATAVGGVPEVITHDVDGLLVPPKDPERLAAAVRALLADENKRRALGQKARRTIEDRFSIQNTTRAYLDVYASILGGRGASASAVAR